MSDEFHIKIPKEVSGKTLEFNTVEEFQAWITQEKSSFQWVQDVKRSLANPVWSHIHQQFSLAQNQVNSIGQNITANRPISGNLESIQNWFKEAYQARKLILSTSSDFKAADQLKEKDSLKAWTFLGHLLSVQNLYSNGIDSPTMIEGGSEFFQYVNGLSNKDLNAEKSALNDLKSDWDTHLITYKAQEDELKAQFYSTKTNFESFYTQLQLDLAEHVKNHTAELEELKKTYNQFMALKAPVEYWKNKRTHHKRLVTNMKKWLMWIGISGAIILAGSVGWSFYNETIPPYWKIAVFLLIGTLFFWTLRVLMKLLLSNIHLETDAHEREVMCQTYLSLLREQTGLNDNDKKLILTTLFRPTSSGLVGDDGIPPGIYDLMTKMVSK